MINAKMIGESVGSCVRVEPVFVMQNRAFLRLQVEIDIKQPLKTGVWWKNNRGVDKWASFKFERLSGVCFVCGMLGHSSTNCGNAMVMSETSQGFPQYGPWIVADRPRHTNKKLWLGGDRRSEQQHRPKARTSWHDLMREATENESRCKGDTQRNSADKQSWWREEASVNNRGLGTNQGDEKVRSPTPQPNHPSGLFDLNEPPVQGDMLEEEQFVPPDLINNLPSDDLVRVGETAPEGARTDEAVHGEMLSLAMMGHAPSMHDVQSQKDKTREDIKPSTLITNDQASSNTASEVHLFGWSLSN